jgi:hypothetical protein
LQNALKKIAHIAAMKQGVAGCAGGDQRPAHPRYMKDNILGIFTNEDQPRVALIRSPNLERDGHANAVKDIDNPVALGNFVNLPA